jgi:hypothetical protein
LTDRPAPSPGLLWEWQGALIGAAYAIPAALLVFNELSRGFALAVGVIPAAVAGLAPTRRARRVTAVLGVFVGVPIALGAVVAYVPWIAVATLMVLGVGTVWLTRRAARIGQVLMTLGLPMFGVGFSYADDNATAVGVAVLMILGSLYAFFVSLLWPERPETRPSRRAPPPPTIDYGVRLGLAGATAAAIGFAFDLDHVGWACAAALLVMRPSAEMQRLRSAGRIGSVTLGAVAGVLVTTAQPAAAVYSGLMIVTVALVAALHRSRWYITPAFTTFVVFLLLLSSDPQSARYRFGERVGETILGVAIACLFGLAAPRLLAPRSARPHGP